jgi:hypothetical protein
MLLLDKLINSHRGSMIQEGGGGGGTKMWSEEGGTTADSAPQNLGATQNNKKNQLKFLG